MGRFTREFLDVANDDSDLLEIAVHWDEGGGINRINTTNLTHSGEAINSLLFSLLLDNISIKINK